jgi:hypothetical protein
VSGTKPSVHRHTDQIHLPPECKFTTDSSQNDHPQLLDSFASTDLLHLDRSNSDVASFLASRGLQNDANKLDGCKPTRHCQSTFCLNCIRYRAIRNRTHLQLQIPKLLDEDINLELWFLTGAAADSPDVHKHATAAVTGMRRLLRHKRLANRVVASFSALEIASKTSPTLPCCHVHSLVVCKQISHGRYRISEADFVHLWERACDLPRLRADPMARMLRRNQNRKKENLSLVAVQIPRIPTDISSTISYVTKQAQPKRLLDDYEKLLGDPDAFINRIQQLHRVPRFFGDQAKT